MAATLKYHWQRVIKNFGLVKKFMSQNRWLLEKSFSLDEVDYLSIGALSLFQSSQAYNSLSPKKKTNLKFSSFAYKHILHDMHRSYQNQAFPAVRVPVYLHEGLSKSDVEVDNRALRAARLALVHHALPEDDVAE